MITLFQRWIEAYPIVSIEDGLDENDWAGFARMTAAMGDRVQIVGDDIFVTNPAFVRRGIAEKTANAVLIKLNQIGTVTETIETIHCARRPDGATSSHIAQARPRTRLSLTLPSRWEAARSRPVRPAAASGSPSTTGSWKSRWSWQIAPCIQRHSHSEGCPNVGSWPIASVPGAARQPQLLEPLQREPDRSRIGYREEGF